MTRSINLKEYQQRLITRMMASRERRSEHTRIGFQVGTRRCLLKLEEAEQILPVPSICPAPLTQTWFCGLAEVRGEVFGVIDLAEFIEKKKTSNNQDTRLIIIGQHLGKPSALMVTKVFGIRHIQKYKMKDKTATYCFSPLQYPCFQP